MSGKVNSGRLKGNLRTLFKHFGVYERAKASWIYDLYWSVADRRIIHDRQREGDFYRTLLDGFRKGDLIFDVGANQGYKSDIFLKVRRQGGSRRARQNQPRNPEAEIPRPKVEKKTLCHRSESSQRSNFDRNHVDRRPREVRRTLLVGSGPIP